MLPLQSLTILSNTKVILNLIMIAFSDFVILISCYILIFNIYKCYGLMIVQKNGLKMLN